MLESPLAHAHIILNDVRTAAVVARLTAPATVDELSAGAPSLSPREAVAGTLALLARAGMLQELSPADTIAEDDDPALQTWAFHGLLFHAPAARVGPTLPMAEPIASPARPSRPHFETTALGRDS